MRLHPHIPDAQAQAPAAEIGSVQALSLRAHAAEPPYGAARVQAVAGLGLDGDRYADALSLRQLLIAGTPAYQRLGLAPHALRENLLLDVDSALLLPGQVLRIGPQAIVWLTFQCEPCGELNLRQPFLTKNIGAQRGMLARVIRSGEIGVGDRVAMLHRSLRHWPDAWRERVAYILRAVPEGMVLEYKQLAHLAGVSRTYCRVFPRLVRDLGLAERVVAATSQSKAPRWDGSGLFDADKWDLAL